MHWHSRMSATKVRPEDQTGNYRASSLRRRLPGPAATPEQERAEGAGGGADQERQPHLPGIGRDAQHVVELADEGSADAVGGDVDRREEDADAEPAQVRTGDLVQVRRRGRNPDQGEPEQKDV